MNRLNRTIVWTIAVLVSLCTASSAVAAEWVTPTTSVFTDSLPYIIGGAITLSLLAVGVAVHLGKRAAESRPGADAQGSQDSAAVNSLDPRTAIVAAPNPLRRLIVPGVFMSVIGVFVVLAASILGDVSKVMGIFGEHTPNTPLVLPVIKPVYIGEGVQFDLTKMPNQPVINPPPFTPPPMLKPIQTPKPFLPPRPIAPVIIRRIR